MGNIIKKETQFLNKMYDAINERFYGNELPQVVLTIQGERAGLKNTFGWFWAERWGKDNHEINITAENFNQKPFGLLTTLHHEMIHLKAHINNIKDTTRQGRWHNKRFAELCIEHGLNVVKCDQIGHRTPHDYDDQSDQMKTFYNELKENPNFQKVETELFQIKRVSNTKPKKETKKVKWVLITCECGFEFKVKEQDQESVCSCAMCGEMLSHFDEN